MSAARHVLLHGRKLSGGGGGVPEGTVVMWTGLLANIPAHWNLCDGTGVTPNLVARFIRGAPAGTDPGATGGLDSHTHAAMTAAGSHTHTAGNLNHTHTVVANGSHDHGAGGTGPVAGGTSLLYGAAGSHQHTNNAAGHTHTMDAPANHTHVRSSDDGRPPFYEVAYLQAGFGAQIVANLVIFWTGTLISIPAGWTLCDGGGGRPELRARFVRGINTAVTNPGTLGGATTHGHTETALAAHSHVMNNTAAHVHTFSAYVWAHTHSSGVYSPGPSNYWYQNDAGAGNHTHANSDSIDTHNHNPMGNDGGHTHVVNAASSLPAYYDVAYIINTGGIIIPSGGVVIWPRLLVNIPIGYNLCDGGGGRADLRSKFARGASAGVDPGGTGGSDTHTHTDTNAGAHSAHAQTAAGNHQHAATDSIGSHSHATAYVTAANVGGAWYGTNNAAGAHSHTYNNEGSHSNHVLTDPGNHLHNPWSTDDGRPAYREIAFIQKA